MSDLQDIGAQVSATASEITGWAQQLHAKAGQLRQAAARAAQGARSAEGDTQAAMRAANMLQAAADACTRAAQHLMAGKSAAEMFVEMHVGATAAAPRFGPSGSNAGNTISNAQAEFVGAEFRTSVGSAFYRPEDLSYRSAAGDVPPYPGEYVLDLHGTPDVVQLVDGDGRGILQLNAIEFAEVVKRTAWSGEPIRLFSCNTGEIENGFAQQLADVLGVPVTAPTAPVWSSSEGGPVSVSDVETVFDPVLQDYIDRPKKPDSGVWRTFYPQQK